MRWFLGVLVGLLVSPYTQGETKAPTVVAQWKGEYLEADQGLIALEARVEGFAPEGALASDDEPLQINLRHSSSKTRYQVIQPLSSAGAERSGFYWKLPIGRYQIESVTRFYKSATFTTKTVSPGRFFVQSLALSDLGVWVARPAKKRELSLKVLGRVIERFVFPQGDDAISAIIDGFSGKRLKLISATSGQKAKNNFGDADEMRATVTHTRAISMVYKMDLGRFGRFNSKMFPAIEKRDSRFRQCYLDGLTLHENLQGTARFNFTLHKSKGRVQDLRHSGGTLGDKKTIECLYAELGQVEFPVKTSVSGQLTFDFKAR